MRDSERFILMRSQATTGKRGALSGAHDGRKTSRVTPHANSGGSTAALKTVTPVTLFGLTNTTTINLNGSASDIVFNGATLVTPIPEPTALGTFCLAGALLLAARRSRSGLKVR
jgi:hypothetical protein